jgi:hypothetical protein
MLCIRCGDTGRYLGNGMMMTDCELCANKDETKSKPAEVPLAKIDRKSKSYQNAIKDIMASNPTLTRNEAVKLFDDAYNKS